MSLLVGVCAVAVAVLVAVGWVVAVADSAPNLDQLTPHNPHPLSEVFAADGTPLGYVYASSVAFPVAGGQIPARLKQATVAIEDRRFYQHGALDYQGILRAGIRDLFGGASSVQGASTLTMQLVNNLYLDNTRYAASHNIKYKIIQAKLAEQLQKGHSKGWVLDKYLNDVPYGEAGGETAIGVGAASRMFFDKPVWKLDLAQEALLAGLPQAPTDYNPFLHPAQARARRAAVLQAMVSSHYLSQAQASAAESERLQVRTNNFYSFRRQPFVFDYVVQQLAQKLCPRTPTNCPVVHNGGLKVYTTLDMKRQQEAQLAIDSHEGGPVLDNQPAAALASVDPSNGNIVALAASATYDQTKYFYPVQARRQTGSAFKVFALMTLIHDYDGDPNQTSYTSKFLPAGWEPAAPDWSVHTAEQTYQGTINLNKATVISDNTVFAQLAADLGWSKLDATAHAMGITSPLNAYPSEVIGGLKDCCTMLEMADAYATLANGGTHVAPTIISRVVFPDGSTMELGDPVHQQVFSSGEAYAATQVLKGVIQSGTGTAANFGCPAAGKTGTAEGLDNAWFVGYTPQLTTAVWVGYPQANIPLGANGFGGTLAAPIWHDYTAQASNGFCGDFPPPASSWSGTAFSGPHSSAQAPSGGSGGSGGSGTAGGSGGSVPYSGPPVPASPATPHLRHPSGGGAAGPPRADQHGGSGGGDNGHGNGGGNGGDHGSGHGGKTH
jgi:penicillin-binding protein 1A